MSLGHHQVMTKHMHTACLTMRGCQVYAACGQGSTGAITVRGHAQRLEVLHESLQALQGVTGLWSLTLSDDEDYQAYVVASFAQSTRVMAVGTLTSPWCLAAVRRLF